MVIEELSILINVSIFSERKHMKTKIQRHRILYFIDIEKGTFGNRKIIIFFCIMRLLTFIPRTRLNSSRIKSVEHIYVPVGPLYKRQRKITKYKI